MNTFTAAGPSGIVQHGDGDDLLYRQCIGDPRQPGTGSYTSIFPSSGAGNISDAVRTRTDLTTCDSTRKGA